MLERPDLFDGIIVVSPSLWYDDHMLSKRERTQRQRLSQLNARVYLGVGSREINSQYDMVGDLRGFAAQLEASSYEGLSLRAEVLDNETHNSVFPRALSNGLRWVYESR